MSSPVKVRADKLKALFSGDPKFIFYCTLAEDVWPSDNITVIEDSQVKLGAFPVWDKSTTGIVDHLFDIKSHTERHIRLNKLKHVDEYFIKLVESVSIPSMRDELRSLEDIHKGDVAILIYLLIRGHHDHFAEQNALDELEALGFFSDMEKYHEVFDRLSNRVTPELLTDKGRARLYVKHVDPRIESAGSLFSKVDEGWQLIRIKNEALRISRAPSTRVVPPTSAPAPAVNPPVPPVFVPPVPPSGPPQTPPPATPPKPDLDMSVDLSVLRDEINALRREVRDRPRTDNSFNSRSRGRGQDRGRGNRGRGGRNFNAGGARSACYVCGRWDHMARDCPDRK